MEKLRRLITKIHNTRSNVVERLDHLAGRANTAARQFVTDPRVRRAAAEYTSAVARRTASHLTAHPAQEHELVSFSATAKRVVKAVDHSMRAEHNDRLRRIAQRTS